MRFGIKDNFVELQGFRGAKRFPALPQRDVEVMLPSRQECDRRNSFWHFVRISLTIDQEGFQK
jgi:hypothetical protein